jgi:DNA topoisomerase VI subunit A
LFIGWLGNIRYYLLDGKVWSDNLGVIARSDDQAESNQLRKQVEALTQLERSDPALMGKDW